MTVADFGECEWLLTRFFEDFEQKKVSTIYFFISFLDNIEITTSFEAVVFNQLEIVESSIFNKWIFECLLAVFLLILVVVRKAFLNVDIEQGTRRCENNLDFVTKDNCVAVLNFIVSISGNCKKL